MDAKKAIEELCCIYHAIQADPSLRDEEDVDEQYSTFLNVISLGDVGVGKSAVLNSLIGHRVLLTGKNGITRVPFCIDLQRDGSLNTNCIVSTIDNITQRMKASKIRNILQQIFFGAASTSEGQRDDMYLKIRTSTAPPLKLIDLPGLDRRTMDDSMIRDFAQYNDAILLVVVPASKAPEISSSRALTLAKEFDVDGTRTIGVITKVDEASSDQEALSAVQALLLDQGTETAAGIKWVALNPLIESVPIASAQSGSVCVDNSLETARPSESESLKSIMPGVPENKIGRVALLETLLWQIRYHKEVRFPTRRDRRRSRTGRRKKEKIEKKKVPLNIEKFDKRLVKSSIDLSGFTSMDSLRAHIRLEFYGSDPEDIALKLVFTVGDNEPFVYFNDEEATIAHAKRLFEVATDLEVYVETEVEEVERVPTIVIIKTFKNRIYSTRSDLSRFTSLEGLRKVLRIMVDRRNHDCKIHLLFTLDGENIQYSNDEEINEAVKTLFERSTQLEVELERPLSPPAPSSPPRNRRTGLQSNTSIQEKEKFKSKFDS